MSGTKYDSKKPDHTLVSKAFIDQVAGVMGYGAEKYGRNNYLGGMEHTRLLAACSRHLTAYNDGQDLDEESGLSHLAHAASNLNMLINCISKGKGKDNRYLKESPKVIEDNTDKNEVERVGKRYCYHPSKHISMVVDGKLTYTCTECGTIVPRKDNNADNVQEAEETCTHCKYTNIRGIAIQRIGTALHDNKDCPYRKIWK